MSTWNPWHGCRKISPGCQHCYVYRRDALYDKDSSAVHKTKDFDLPVRALRSGEYKIPAGDTVYTCFTSDFFLEEADEWRPEAWAMMWERQDLFFFFITKRIDRFHVGLPEDWGTGYDNVAIGCTCENGDRADYRLPIFLKLPIKHKLIHCEPFLEPVNLTPYLTPGIERVTVGGESGPGARLCRYDWVLDVRGQCQKAGVPFTFKQTGARFEKNGKIYVIDRKDQEAQAKKAGIDIG